MNLLLALLLALPNTTTICSEVCSITAISSPTAVLNFGGCATNITAPKLPLTVNYGPPNLALCATDPAPGVIKTIVAQQEAAAYTVTYTKNGASTVVTVPALPTPPPTVLSTETCNITLTLTHYSDGTSGVTGPFSCK